MKNVKKILIFSILATISCNNEKENPISSSQLNINGLKKEIVYDKNIESYGVFLDISSNDTLNYESLPFSILMANEQNPKASVMVFVQMIEVFNKKKFTIKKFSDLPEANKDFALYYLKKGAEMGSVSGQVYLEEIYRKGIGVEKNEMKADSILNVLRKQKGYKDEHRLTFPGMRE
ncbi:hypothetical protein J2X31_003714 [Flavobacterium arsenatis]|uniref:Lipoprotein n=1 Tax=Flavobacterium arsenatis TaxID=1484332 RepID=A0ABU1TUY8_9FLAO|nr:hypothetical protein [Flavobacterium arsenatis]MDR6969680.1 hypothetical protein [Flavobacterium arsenatis]